MEEFSAEELKELMAELKEIQLESEGEEANDEDLTDPILLAELDQLNVTAAASSGDQEEEQNDAGVVEQSEKIEVVKTSLEIERQVELELVEEEGGQSLDERNKIMKVRVLEYKSVALVYKKAGLLEKAREMLVISKLIQKALDDFEVDFILPAVPTNPPLIPILVPAADNFQVRPKLESSPKAQVPIEAEALMTVGSPDMIEHFTTLLDSQIATCVKVATYYFTQNQKDEALRWHKRKKGLIQDKEGLEKKKTFQYRLSTLEYSIATSNADIPLDQIEVKVVRGQDVVSNDSDTVVSVEFLYGTEGKLESKSLVGPNPNYNFTSRFPIDSSKSFIRFLERKKVNFEVLCLSKGMFGLWSKRLSVGKGSLKLDDLMTKSTIHQTVLLSDPSNSRRLTGALLEVLVRVRAPLVKQEMVKVKEQWLEISFGLNLPIKLNSNAIALSAEDEIDDLETKFLTPDNIASNAVLEYELGVIQAQLLTSPRSEDLLDLKISYEIRINLLVTMIQMGRLDMNTYLDLVKQSIIQTKPLALRFKKAGKLEMAKRALLRCKLMAGEVAEAESALASV